MSARIRASFAPRLDPTITGAIAAGFVVAGCVGAGIALEVQQPRVVTEVLPLSEACAESVEAAEVALAADDEAERLQTDVEDAGEAFVAALEHSAENAEPVLEALSVAQDERDAAAGERDVAARQFRDARNRCLTDVDAVRAGARADR